MTRQRPKNKPYITRHQGPYAPSATRIKDHWGKSFNDQREATWRRSTAAATAIFKQQEKPCD